MTREELSNLINEASKAFHASFTEGADGKLVKVLDQEAFRKWSDRHNALCDVSRNARVLRDTLKECGVYESGEVGDVPLEVPYPEVVG